jgi:hypothetical protein
MRRILSLFLIVLSQAFLSTEAKAQAQTSSCPSVRVESKPDHPVRSSIGELFCPGDDVTFTATVEGAEPGAALTFNWTVSNATIMSGQGSTTIRVSSDEPLRGEIKAEVEVGGLIGLEPECERRASKILDIATCCVSPCPTLSISCPTELLMCGAPATVALNVSGGDPNLNLKYKWQVSAGKITSGQGTPQITVDMGETGETITATVEVEGLPPECDRIESCSFSVSCDPPSARKFDEYSSVSRMNEEARLDNFRVQLQGEPDSQGYVIIYGPHSVSEHLRLVRKFLFERRGIAPPNVVLVNGGYNKQPKVELWMVPTGATPPKPDPDY